jgi:hypothetical protein
MHLDRSHQKFFFYVVCSDPIIWPLLCFLFVATTIFVFHTTYEGRADLLCSFCMACDGFSDPVALGLAQSERTRGGRMDEP